MYSLIGVNNIKLNCREPHLRGSVLIKNYTIQLQQFVINNKNQF